MKKQNFLQGALILMVASLIVKIFGAIFKIPLTNIIGVTSMAYFNTAYGFYVVFYMISTAGIPVAISKMISSAEARGNKSEISKIFRISYILFFALGVLGTVIMALFAKKYSAYVKLDNLHFSILAITPTLFFICLTSAYRGYFQGMKNMLPTAISQIIGAIGKLFIGIVVAIIAVKHGAPDYLVAAYTILGITVGSIGSTIFLSIFKKYTDKKDNNTNVVNSDSASSGALLKSLISIAIPITLSATILSLTNTIDTTLMVRRLTDSGIEISEATKIMGAYTSMAVPLHNLAPNMIYPFAISVIPTITALFVAKKNAEAEGVIASTFRITSLIAIPCALGLSTFSRPIVNLLYDSKEIISLSSDNSVSAINIASEMLSILSISVFFVSMVSITNGFLQAYGKERLTIISTTIGIAFKIIANYILIGNKHINIYGAPISTLLCYFLITIINFYFLIKHCEYKPKILSTIVKPVITSAFSIALSALLYHFLYSHYKNTYIILPVIFMTAILYFASMFLIKGVDKEDVKMLPKGEKILNLLIRVKLIK